jgi:tetratricopeptide (TPR) repeat protein
MSSPLEAVSGSAALDHLRAAKAHAKRGETYDAVRAYLAAGSALLHEETDTANARRALEAALSLDPQSLDAEFQIARIDVIEGRLSEALTRFQRVIDRSGQSHVPALFEAGCIYQELGRYDRAILTFRKVLDLDRTNVQAIVNVGRHLQAMGMRPEALGYYVRAAEAAFDSGQIGTCRHLLGLVLSIDPLHAKGRTMLIELNDAKSGLIRGEHEPSRDAPQEVSTITELAAAALPPAPEAARASLPRREERPPEKRDPSWREVPALRQEIESLRREIEGLGAAKGAVEVELASLRARRDCAVAELDEIYAAVESAKRVGRETSAATGARGPKKPRASKHRPPKTPDP